LNNSKTGKTIGKIINVLIIALFTFYCFELVILHFNQTQYTLTGKYESDLFAHIDMALSGWGYSILAVIFRLLSKLPPFMFYFSIAALLCFFEAFTISITYMIFKIRGIDTGASLILAFASGFVMPFYLRSVQPYRYIGYQSASVWHNSTYIAMKFFGLLCIILYLVIAGRFKSGLKAWQVIAFSILLAITTSVKTNFILVFAPVALVFLILDLLRKVPFKRILICALTVIPSIAVILFQQYVLFGEDTGNTIIVDPLYSVYLRAGQPYFTMILSAAFPVFVFIYNIIFVLRDTVKDFKDKNEDMKHRFFLLSWSMWFVGFCELILLRENGVRELDDNFAWGYDFCLFLVFVVGMIYFVKNMQTIIKYIKYKRINKLSGKIDIAMILNVLYIAVGLALLIYHTYCGVYFFVRLTQGVTFFMQ